MFMLDRSTNPWHTCLLIRNHNTMTDDTTAVVADEEVTAPEAEAAEATEPAAEPAPETEEVAA